RSRRHIATILLSLLLGVYAATIGASVIHAQQPSPSPTPSTTSVDFGEELARMSLEASRWLPHLIYEVESPLSDYFTKLAQVIGLAIIMTAFLKLLRQHMGRSWDLGMWFSRIAFFIAMITLTGAAIDFAADMGNAIAYGSDVHTSWLNQVRL